MYPHMLRHTFATRLMETTGGDIRSAQEALGHADPKTTSIYLRVRPARLKDAFESLTYEEAT